jgi:hypothetical protein
MDRRAIFFLGAAVACLVLVPLTPASLRYVSIWISIAYVILGTLSFLDDRARRSR